MSKNGKIAVGIIGAGNIAGQHIPGYLQAAEHARVTAIADVDGERASKYTAQLGSVQVFLDYRDMVASPEIDAVDICLPHHLHKDAIVAAAAAGKHILCEKPLCRTLDEADTVTRAVAASGVTLMCAHNQLFLPSVATAREMIREGKLGKVYAARTTDVFALNGTAETFGWRARRGTNGGGGVVDTGDYPNYPLADLVGSPANKKEGLLGRDRPLFLWGGGTAPRALGFVGAESGRVTELKNL